MVLIQILFRFPLKPHPFASYTDSNRLAKALRGLHNGSPTRAPQEAFFIFVY